MDIKFINKKKDKLKRSHVLQFILCLILAIKVIWSLFEPEYELLNQYNTEILMRFKKKTFIASSLANSLGVEFLDPDDVTSIDEAWSFMKGTLNIALFGENVEISVTEKQRPYEIYGEVLLQQIRYDTQDCEYSDLGYCFPYFFSTDTESTDVLDFAESSDESTPEWAVYESGSQLGVESHIYGDISVYPNSGYFATFENPTEFAEAKEFLEVLEENDFINLNTKALIWRGTMVVSESSTYFSFYLVLLFFSFRFIGWNPMDQSPSPLPFA